jgi:hypothetical protein
VAVTNSRAPAPFLATGCLNQLASKEASSYPIAAEVISRDMYVDDLVKDLIIFQRLEIFKKK